MRKFINECRPIAGMLLSLVTLMVIMTALAFIGGEPVIKMLTQASLPLALIAAVIGFGIDARRNRKKGWDR